MKLDQQDVVLIGLLLPNNSRYNVSLEDESAVRCTSNIGFSDDLDNDIEFDKFAENVRRLFGNRVSEFYHHTCTRHKDFMIYFKKQ